MAFRMTKNDAHTEGQAENLIVSKTIQTVLTNADGNPVGWMNLNPQCWVRPLFLSSPFVVVFWGSGTAFAFILPALPCSFYPFPHCSLLSLTCSSAGGHPLCLRCLTMEIWRPKLRWTEQHSSQIRTPRLILVQPGSGRQKEISGWCYYEPHKHSTYTATLPGIQSRSSQTSAPSQSPVLSC